MIVFLTLMMSICSFAHARTPLNTVVLQKGGTRNIKAPRRLSIRVMNGRVIGVRDLGQSIQVQGRSVGSSSLQIGPRTIQVDVVKHKSFVVYKKLQQLTSKMMGLTVAVDKGQVELRGSLLRLNDWLEIRRRISREMSYRFAARLDSSLQAKARRFFARLFKSHQLPPAHLMFDVPPLAEIPSGSSSDLNGRYQKLLAPFGLLVKMDRSLVAVEPMVRVKVVMAELNHKTMTSMGIAWPDSETAQLLPNHSWQASSPVWNLQALEQRGLAKILASPTLVCRSGHSAKFLAGGEIPIKMISRYREQVIWKHYGVSLNIKPKADFSGDMDIQLESEISMIDPSEAVDGVPGFLTNRIQSDVNMTGSKTIVISGLIRQEWSRDGAGLPLLSRVPILGPLFSSRDYRRHKSELVIFLTPQLIANPNHNEMPKMPKGWADD